VKQKKSENLKRELKRIVLLYLVVASIGLLFDQLPLALAIATVSYFVLIYRELNSFYAWLEGKRKVIPEDNAFLFDIAERFHHSKQKTKRIKQRLHEQLKTVQESTSALSDGVLITGSKDRLTWWNGAAQSMLGLTHKSDVGQSILNFMRAPHFVAYLDAGDFSKPVEVVPSLNESLTLQIQVTNFGAAQRLFVIRDITKVAQLEQMRKDFVGNVSHELRTPLTVLKGYFENLELMEDMLPPPLRRAITQMSDQVERMNDTVSDLMLLSRLDEEDRIDLEQAVDMHALMQRVEGATQAALSDRHSLKLDICEASIKGVESELYSAISNIIYNAIKYSPEGGEIGVTMDRKDDRLVVSVSDQGVGIDPKHITRLTERFYRVDSARTRDIGGTGLGLAIVKHVLMRHRAELLIESKPGEGSVFSCVFHTLPPESC